MDAQGSESAQRWLLERCKVPGTLDDLPKDAAPASTADPTAYALLVSGVDPWPIPTSLRKRLEAASLEGRQQTKIACSVSMSFYHTLSKRFFGSTHVGSAHSFSITSSTKIPMENTNELVYFHSRLHDPNTFIVVELVTSILSSLDNSVSSRFGCGWALIPLQDDCHREVSTGRIPLYNGSPRDLLQLKGSGLLVLNQLEASKKGSMLSYTVSRPRGLGEALSSCTREHQIVGASSAIAGLRCTRIDYFDNRSSLVETCVGAYTKGNALDWTLLPPMDCPAILASLSALEASNITVEIPHRLDMEKKLTSWVGAALPKAKGRMLSKMFGWNKLKAEAKGEGAPVTSSVTHRKLRIGAHNGHVVLNNQWHEVELCATNESDQLRAPEGVAISTYVDHPSCALLCAIEYTMTTTRTTRGLQSPTKETTSNSTVVVGVGVLCSVDRAGLNEASANAVTLTLFNDSRYQALCTHPIYSPARGDSAERTALSFELRSFDATRAVEELNQSGVATNEAKESDDSVSLDGAVKSSFLRINVDKRSSSRCEAKSDCTYVSMIEDRSMGDASTITDASSFRPIKSPAGAIERVVTHPVSSIDDISKASYEYSASVEVGDENTLTEVTICLHAFTVPLSYHGRLPKSIRFRFSLYTLGEVSTDLFTLHGTEFADQSSFTFDYDYATVDKAEELALFLMERDLVLEVFDERNQVVGTLMLPMHLFLRQGKSMRRLENLSVDVISGKNFVGSLTLSMQCMGVQGDKLQDTSETQRPASKRVVARCLLDTCPEVRSIATELRGYYGAQHREADHTSHALSGFASSLRQQQLQAVEDFRVQRRREGHRTTDTLGSFFGDIAGARGHDDDEARVRMAVEWAREGMKKQIIAEHVQKYHESIAGKG